MTSFLARWFICIYFEVGRVPGSPQHNILKHSSIKYFFMNGKQFIQSLNSLFLRIYPHPTHLEGCRPKWRPGCIWTPPSRVTHSTAFSNCLNLNPSITDRLASFHAYYPGEPLHVQFVYSSDRALSLQGGLDRLWHQHSPCAFQDRKSVV